MSTSLSTTSIQTQATTSTESSLFSPIGMLRRQLYGELAEVRDQISHSNLHDEMTCQIFAWQERFVAALRSSADEERVCQSYIALLQHLLCDPITKAPLDMLAVLGTDGHTYGQMSLQVHRLSVPAEYRNRSPLNPTDPTPFVVSPHIVVRHMTRWLVQHNAFLYSEELESAYVRLLPQSRPSTIQDRIERIRARQAKLNMVEAERRRSQHQQLDKDLAARLEAWTRSLQERFSEVPSEAAINGPKIAISERLEKARQKLERGEAYDQSEIARLNERLDGMANSGMDVHEAVLSAAEKEEASIARLTARIQTSIQLGLGQIAERVDSFSNETLRTISETSQKDQESLHHLEETIREMRARIEIVNVNNHALQKKQKVVAAQIGQLQQEEVALQQGISETKAAIQEMQNRDSNSLFKTIAIVGVSIFCTWAIQGLLASTSFGASVGPLKGGVKLTITKNL